MAKAVDLDAKVVSSKKLKPLAEPPEAKTTDVCKKLSERLLQDDDWTRMKSGWDGDPSSNFAAGSLT